MNDLPTRKSIRLENYDYSQNGAYFITICVEEKRNLLGEIRNNERILNAYGMIVDEYIDKIGSLHDGIEINKKVVMPNHIHFILSLVGVAYHATRGMAELSIQEKSKMTVPKMIQLFKAATVKRCRGVGLHDVGLHNMQPLRWQRGYYEHIIRNEDDYLRIWQYIDENPVKWAEDKYFVDTCHEGDYHE